MPFDRNTFEEPGLKNQETKGSFLDPPDTAEKLTGTKQENVIKVRKNPDPPSYMDFIGGDVEKAEAEGKPIIEMELSSQHVKVTQEGLKNDPRVIIDVALKEVMKQARAELIKKLQTEHPDLMKEFKE